MFAALVVVGPSTARSSSADVGARGTVELAEQMRALILGHVVDSVVVVGFLLAVILGLGGRSLDKCLLNSGLLGWVLLELGLLSRSLLEGGLEHESLLSWSLLGGVLHIRTLSVVEHVGAKTDTLLRCQSPVVKHCISWDERPLEVPSGKVDRGVLLGVGLLSRIG